MEVQNFIQLFLLNFLQFSIAVPPYLPYELNEFSSKCKPPNYKCFDGVCIPPEWKCDGKEDCLHGEDEDCIKESSLQAKEEQQIRKRSPQYFSNFNDPAMKEKALSLIFTANEALERGMIHIISSEPNVDKKITKRNQDILLLEEEVEEEENFSTLQADGSTAFISTTFQITSDSSVDSSISHSSEETEASSVGSLMSTEFTTAQVSSMSTNEEETDAMSVTEDPSAVTSKSDLFQEKLMILEEIISHYLSLKDWLEEVLNHNQNNTNCPNIDQNNNTSTTEAITTTDSSTTIINVTTTKEPLTITKITCPYHFQYMNGICIFVQIYPPVPWFEASALCNAQHSNLIIINSKEFFEKLLKQLNFDRMRVYDFWIGATNQNSNGIWSWTDGTKIANFDAWGFNINRNNIDLFLSYNKPNQCGFLDGKLYSYINEASCYEPKGFICQYKPKYQEIFYFADDE